MNLMMINIKVNQIWIQRLRLHDDSIARRIRILAHHPDGGLIFKDEPAALRLNHFEIRTIPNVFHFEKVFELEKDVCEHKHTRDGYANKAYPSATPDVYVCEDCEDTFPNNG